MSFISFWVNFLGVVVVASIILGLALIPVSLILNWVMEWWNKRCEKKDRQSAIAQKEQVLAEREKALEEKERLLAESEQNLDDRDETLTALQDLLTAYAQEHGLAELPEKFEKEI